MLLCIFLHFTASTCSLRSYGHYVDIVIQIKTRTISGCEPGTNALGNAIQSTHDENNLSKVNTNNQYLISFECGWCPR